MSLTSSSEHGDGVAFLLAQLGHRAAALFAEQVATLELTPPHAGILRLIASEPGLSQQALSARLEVLPSRIVAYVDELEDRGYVERRRHPSDRRLRALYLTPAGKKLMRKLSELARQHEHRFTAGLNAEQRGALRGMLRTLAQQQGLTPHVHPGYRALPRLANSRPQASSTATPPQAGGGTSRLRGRAPTGRKRPASSPAEGRPAKPAG